MTLLNQLVNHLELADAEERQNPNPLAAAKAFRQGIRRRLGA